jgi:hypothetical protein
VFELSQDRDELLLPMLVDVVDCPTQPLPVNAIVGGQPCSRSRDSC